MRNLSFICLLSIVLAVPTTAALAKNKSNAAGGIGTTRDDCRAQAQGMRGVSKQAAVNACVQRNKKR